MPKILKIAQKAKPATKQNHPKSYKTPQKKKLWNVPSPGFDPWPDRFA